MCPKTQAERDRLNARRSLRAAIHDSILAGTFIRPLFRAPSDYSFSRSRAMEMAADMAIAPELRAGPTSVTTDPVILDLDDK